MSRHRRATGKPDAEGRFHLLCTLQPEISTPCTPAHGAHTAYGMNRTTSQAAGHRAHTEQPGVGRACWSQGQPKHLLCKSSGKLQACTAGSLIAPANHQDGEIAFPGGCTAPSAMECVCDNTQVSRLRPKVFVPPLTAAMCSTLQHLARGCCYMVFWHHEEKRPRYRGCSSILTLVELFTPRPS